MDHRNSKSQKRLEDTTMDKQAVGFIDAHWETRPNDHATVVPTGDKIPKEELTTVEGTKHMLAQDRRATSSTSTTVSSESKQTGKSSNIHTSSCILEAETNPTSSPSEVLDEPDRKSTESPVDSDVAVYGSNSVHSASSESPTERSDSKRTTTTAVDLEVKAMGGQFEGPCSGGEAASFHNPANDIEAEFIKDKVQKANSEPSKLTLFSLVTDGFRSYHG